MKILLLPGMDGTDKLSARMREALGPAADVEIIAYPADRFLDYAELESLVRARLPRSGDFVLVAESFSGPIALRVATRPPPNLKLLVLVASFFESPHPGLRWILPWLPFRLLLRRALAGGLVTRFLLGDQGRTQALEALRRALADVPAGVLRRRLAAMARLPPAHGRIDLPCVYLRPRGDNLIAARNLEVIRHIAPGVRIRELDGRHFVVETHPRDCAMLLREALASIDAAPVADPSSGRPVAG